jgi:hypothetical protein
MFIRFRASLSITNNIDAVRAVLKQAVKTIFYSSIHM